MLITLKQFQFCKDKGMSNREILDYFPGQFLMSYGSVLNAMTVSDESVTYKNTVIPLHEFGLIPSFAEIGRKYDLDRNTVRYIGNALGHTTRRDIAVRFRRTKAPLLNSEQRQIVLGSLFGDAYISKSLSFGMQHKKEHSEYIHWLYEKMKPFATSQPKPKRRILDGKTYEGLRFNCRVTEEFYSLRQDFYPNGIKIVPKKHLSALDPLGLAVWYMDDGGTSWYCTKGTLTPLARIYTLGFNESEHDLMIDFFRERYQIVAYKGKHKAGKKHILCFDTANTAALFSLMKPHILRSLQYKVVRDEEHQS